MGLFYAEIPNWNKESRLHGTLVERFLKNPRKQTPEICIRIRKKFLFPLTTVSLKKTEYPKTLERNQILKGK